MSDLPEAKLTPDILILDLRLGDGSGFDILRQLNAQNIQTQVIVFTSFSSPQYRDMALRLGAVHCIDKSDDEMFFDVLREIFEDHRS